MTNRIPRKIAFNIRKGLCRLTIEESMDYVFHEVLAKDNERIVLKRIVLKGQVQNGAPGAHHS